MNNMSHDDFTCLVTGATSGIGEAIATGLAVRGARVVAVARDPRRGADVVARIRRQVPAARIDPLVADLSLLTQVRVLAKEVRSRYDRLDVLVLNAAVARPRLERTDEGFEVDFATNHLSPFLLTHALTGLVTDRIVTVSSSGHRHVKSLDLDALTVGDDFHHLRTYSATKLLNILFTAELARRLAGSGVTANAADPGFARTRLGRDSTGAFKAFLTLARPFQLAPARAAATPLHVATAPEVAGVTGAYFEKRRPVNPSDLALDRALAERLWTLSERLVAETGE